jgi:hypothetical protein
MKTWTREVSGNYIGRMDKSYYSLRWGRLELDEDQREIQHWLLNCSKGKPKFKPIDLLVYDQTTKGYTKEQSYEELSQIYTNVASLQFLTMLRKPTY